MSMHFRDLAEQAMADGAIDADEILALRQEGWSNGAIDADEADAIFVLNDHLAGSSAEWSDFFVEALSALPSREFNAAALRSETEGVLDQADIRALLRQLFTIGGLGVRTRQGGILHTNFVYRRTAGGGFSFVADYVLHSSLVVAWNLQW